MATGDEKFTCCQPEPLSPVKVALASSGTAAAPEMPHVRARVIYTLVEADSGNEAAGTGCELHPQFDRDDSDSRPVSPVSLCSARSCTDIVAADLKPQS